MVPKPNSYSRHSHAKPVYFCAKPTTQPSRSPYPLPVHIIAHPIRPVQTPQNRHFPLKTGFSRNWWGLVPSKVDQEIGLGLKNTSGVALIAKPRWRKKKMNVGTHLAVYRSCFFDLFFKKCQPPEKNVCAFFWKTTFSKVPAKKRPS